MVSQTYNFPTKVHFTCALHIRIVQRQITLLHTIHRKTIIKESKAAYRTTEAKISCEPIVGQQGSTPELTLEPDLLDDFVTHLRSVQAAKTRGLFAPRSSPGLSRGTVGTKQEPPF
jgi:hypothetical protein